MPEKNHGPQNRRSALLATRAYNQAIQEKKQQALDKQAGPPIGSKEYVKQISTKVYQKASYLEQPKFYAQWTEAATFAALPLGGAAPVEEMLNEGAIGLEVEAPGTISAATDFANGFMRSTNPPLTPAGVAGAVVNDLTKLF